jgi:membrane protein YdbS with pleckstrin-like domain
LLVSFRKSNFNLSQFLLFFRQLLRKQQEIKMNIFCPNCRFKIEISNSKFCSSCGFALLPPEKTKVISNHLKKEPIFIAYPNFIFLNSLISNLFLNFLLHIFFFVWITIAISAYIYSQTHSPFSYIIIFLFYVLTTAVSIYIHYKDYTSTEYCCYEEHIEYKDSFWTFDKKFLRYKNIIDIELRMGIIQRGFSLGNIFLYTAASSKENNSNTIILKDLENYEEAYQFFQQVLAKS